MILRVTGGAVPDAEATYADLFHARFRGLVRLAALLGADDPEDLAQEAFCRLHPRLRRMRDPQASLAYLRSTVVNPNRSGLRHPHLPAPDAASAEHHATVREDHREVVAALRTLSPRHREALVLRSGQQLAAAPAARALGDRGTLGVAPYTAAELSAGVSLHGVRASTGEQLGRYDIGGPFGSP